MDISAMLAIATVLVVLTHVVLTNSSGDMYIGVPAWWVTLR